MPVRERDTTRVNERIRVPEVRVISEDGVQLGVMATSDALERARNAGLDLVEVAPRERPPVCRIMDYGKFKYERKKKKSQQGAHQTKTKEIRLRPKTGEHDIDFKVKKAIGFLQHKDKVQVTIMFRGREMAHVEEGQKVMAHVLELLDEYGKVESPPKQQGRRMTCLVVPK